MGGDVKCRYTTI